MWELSISVASKNIDIAKFVYQTLKNETQEVGAVVTCYEQFDNFFIVIGCEQIEQPRVCCVIERCVIKVVCNFYKERFLTENLKLPAHEDIGLTAFKKALINFDKETDFYIISKNIRLENNLHLDSFYNFKLKALREKWGELIALANENSDCLVNNEAFLDLLKFLVDNLEICEEEISVFQDENGYSIKARDAGILCNLSNEGLVSSIIELCPKRINFFCRSDDSTAGFLSKIFEERMNVCYNKNLEIVDNFSVLK